MSKQYAPPVRRQNTDWEAVLAILIGFLIVVSALLAMPGAQETDAHRQRLLAEWRSLPVGVREAIDQDASFGGLISTPHLKRHQEAWEMWKSHRYDEAGDSALVGGFLLFGVGLIAAGVIRRLNYLRPPWWRPVRRWFQRLQ